MGAYGYKDLPTKNESKNTVSEESIFTREVLCRLWEQRKVATPSSFSYHLGLCDSLPPLSCEERSKRWLAKEEVAEEMRNLWESFYVSVLTKQDLQSRLLEGIRKIKRHETMVLKKNDQGVYELWGRLCLYKATANELLKELWQQTGVEKPSFKTISTAGLRTERLKALGNSLVYPLVVKLFEAIKYAEEAKNPMGKIAAIN
jgi:hypothetical protein